MDETPEAQLADQVRDLRKMLLLVIDHLAMVEWQLGTTQSYALQLRATTENTTTNAIIHEELRDPRPSRVLESLHDQYYSEARSFGLADVMALFKDPSELPPKRKMGKKK